MDEQSRFFHCVENLYSSVLDDTRWENALLDVARLVGGHGTSYLASNPATCEVLASLSIGIDPKANELILGPLADKEIRMAPALRAGVGQIVVDRELVDWRLFKRSEIYGDLCLPFDVPNMMGLWLRKSPHNVVSLAVHSSSRHGEFTTQEIERFTRIAPYLIRMHHFRELMARARQAKQLNDELLERMPFGVILLDFCGQVIEMTCPARQMIRSDAGLSYRMRGLHAHHSDDEGALRRLIHAALHWRGAATDDPDFVRIRRSTGSPLLVIAVPLINLGTVFAPDGAACALLLIDPDRKMGATIHLLEQGLNLTAAEARLAARIFQGDSLAEAARQLEVSYNTCKSQIKAIYEKTGCTSQVALAKKMMQISFVGASAAQG